MIEIRPLSSHEIPKIKKIATRAFGPVERLFLGNLKHTQAAYYDQQLAGAIIWKTIKIKALKVGYFDTAFMDPAYQGKGIGKQLYQETTQHLWNQDCDALFALVKDDNVASWQLFYDCGFKRVGWKEVIRLAGWQGALKIFFKTPCFIGNGMEMYWCDQQRTVIEKNSSSWSQIFAYLAVNFILMLIPAFLNHDQPLLTLSAMLTVLSLELMIGGLATLFTSIPWQFRLNSAGAAISLAINLTGFFPMIAKWYPTTYEKGQKFKQALGIVALSEWLLLLLLSSTPHFITHPFTSLISQISGILLIFRLLPFYPFESFGATRVKQWNQYLYWAMFLLTAALLWI